MARLAVERGECVQRFRSLGPAGKTILVDGERALEERLGFPVAALAHVHIAEGGERRHQADVVAAVRSDRGDDILEDRLGVVEAPFVDVDGRQEVAEHGEGDGGRGRGRLKVDGLLHRGLGIRQPSRLLERQGLLRELADFDR